jgi:hypothetical protein
VAVFFVRNESSVCIRWEEFLLAERQLASQGRPYSRELVSYTYKEG